MNIAIDTGNKSIKTKHSTFVAGITERATEPTTSAKTDWIRYEGKYYVLSGNRGEYMKDKTINDRYFIRYTIGRFGGTELQPSGQPRFSRSRRTFLQIYR